MNRKLMVVPFIECKVNEIEKDGRKYYEVSGYGSTFGNIDRGNDICVEGCFKESLLKMTPKILWQHNFNEPVGIIVEIGEDEKGLKMTTILPADDDFVSKRVVPQIRIGSVDSFSIGYVPVESEYDHEKDIRKLKKVDLYEVSFVTLPMNPQARIEAIKTLVKSYEGVEDTDDLCEVADMNYKWIPEEAKKRIDGKGFEVNGEIFDIVEEKLVVVPRAIFCLKAKILKSGGEMSQEEATKAKTLCNRYYSKMGLQKPFVDGVEPQFSFAELSNMPNSEMVYVLKNHKISKSCADQIAKILLSMNDEEKETDVSELKSGVSATLEDIKKLFS